MRELVGLTATCDGCYGMFTLADAKPCDHLPRQERKAAFHTAIATLAGHNRWPVEKVHLAIKKSRETRKPWDHYTWASDVSWLIKHRLLAEDDIKLNLRATHKNYTLWNGAVITEPSFIALPSQKPKASRGQRKAG